VLTCYVPDNPSGSCFVPSYHPVNGLPCGGDCFVENRTRCPHPFKYRNYDVFAILANVRNGRGFAGVVTGGGFNPIAMPRGLPPDVSPEVLREYALRVVPDDCYAEEAGTCSASNAARWTTDRGYGASSHWIVPGEVVSGPDWHSASWLTLAELLAFDWGQATTHRGVVSPEGYATFKATGKPESWCGGIGGSRVVMVGNAEMERRIAAQTAGSEADFSNPCCYTEVEWREPYRVSAKRFVEDTIPRLQALGGAEDVRMVFWFDN
jgi:hypothetical protein